MQFYVSSLKRKETISYFHISTVSINIIVIFLEYNNNRISFD